MTFSAGETRTHINSRIIPSGSLAHGEGVGAASQKDFLVVFFVSLALLFRAALLLLKLMFSLKVRITHLLGLLYLLNLLPLFPFDSLTSFSAFGPYPSF